MKGFALVALFVCCFVVVFVDAGVDDAAPPLYDPFVVRRTQDVRKGGIPKTQGAVWPKPQLQKVFSEFLVALPSKFVFNITGKTCDILDAALKRYYILIFDPPRLVKDGKFENEDNLMKYVTNRLFHGFLKNLEVNLQNACNGAWPNENMDEQYELKINAEDLPGRAVLYSQSIWGILRGLETFSQLIYHNDDGIFLLNSTLIRDFPRFSFRSIMLDTSRHYLPKSVILENLEAMAENKFNVFHWHIVDDDSFPYQSRVFPSLSAEGAYNSYTHIYTLDDILDVLRFARLRGIRVIPEFDTPGHTQAWGWGIQGLLTPCFKNVSGKIVPDGFGPINPTLNSTYQFLKKLLTEVSQTFPERYLHLGGDEVSFDCWKSNPDITNFMKKMGFGTDYSKLEEYYMQRLLDIVKSISPKLSYIIWQEVVDNGVTVKPDTVVEVWKSPYQEELANVTKKGYRTLLSACWYFNYISYGPDWKDFYLCDPHNFNGTDEQKQLVFGGEACMWGEYVDATNLIPRFWPRASAAAERLWSNITTVDLTEATYRLEEHRCRMLIRGINAEPNSGPGFCPVDYRIR